MIEDTGLTCQPLNLGKYELTSCFPPLFYFYHIEISPRLVFDVQLGLLTFLPCILSNCNECLVVTD